MTDHICRSAAAAAVPDIPALKALWHEVFGDDIADIDRFFETFYAPDLTAVIHDGGTPVAAAYAVPSGELVLPSGDRFQMRDDLCCCHNAGLPGARLTAPP